MAAAVLLLLPLLLEHCGGADTLWRQGLLPRLVCYTDTLFVMMVTVFMVMVVMVMVGCNSYTFV
jgi:hypothetical protein